jgi:RNA polymerase sigma factor (sigma-70 family)
MSEIIDGFSSNEGEIQMPSISELYANEFSSLAFIARRTLSDSVEAEDVVQEAFLYLMTSGTSLHTQEDAIRFLRWKVKNLAIDRLRRVKPVNVDPAEHLGNLQSPDQSDVLAEFETAEEAAIVSLALAKLPARQRESLVRQHVLGQPIEEAANEMNLSTNALRQLSSRGRSSFAKTLREELAKRGLSTSEFLNGRYLRVLGVASVLIMVITGGPVLQGLLQESSLSVASSGTLTSPVAESRFREPVRPSGLGDSGSAVFVEPSEESNPSTNPVLEAPKPALTPPTESDQAAVAPSSAEFVVASTTIPEPEPVGDQAPSELQLSSLNATYLESRLLTQLTNASTKLSSLQEDERLVRTITFDGEEIESVIRFVDDGISETGTAWVYFKISDSLAGSYWVAPSLHHLIIRRDSENSMTGISLVATDFLVGDASGQQQFKVSENTDLAPVYFFMDAEVRNFEVKRVTFKTSNFAVGA